MFSMRKSAAGPRRQLDGSAMGRQRHVLARPGEGRDVCNLYRMTSTTAEIARLFGAWPDMGANFAAEVYPGYPGLVMVGGQARAMTWGLPVKKRKARLSHLVSLSRQASARFAQI
jgi:hypothetical protein